MAKVRTPLTQEELSDLMDVLMDVGVSMLQSGAASFRTEETVTSMGLGLGADSMDVYITPTGIIATATSGEERHTRVRSLKLVGVDMAQILAFDRLSRRIRERGGTLDTVRRQVGTIRAAPRDLPAWVTVPAVAVACGAFSKNLGGDWPEFLAATVGAGIAQWLRLVLHRLGVNFLILTVLCAHAASLVAWGVAQLVPGDAPTLGMAASVLLLVPGVPLVTTVIDLTQYDLVSGVTRGTMALIITLSIGLGVMLTLWITGMNILP